MTQLGNRYGRRRRFRVRSHLHYRTVVTRISRGSGSGGGVGIRDNFWWITSGNKVHGTNAAEVEKRKTELEIIVFVGNVVDCRARR